MAGAQTRGDSGNGLAVGARGIPALSESPDTPGRQIAGLEKYPPPGSRVLIRFHVNSAGLVARIDDVEENAGKPATYACLNAITGPQPYPRWSSGMIAALGDEQEVTLAFYFHDADEPHDLGVAEKNPLPPGGHAD